MTTGRITAEFEQAFAERVGAAHAVSVNSATAGLHLALEAAGIGPGDEVIVPTWTFTASAEVVRYLGADPVLVDVDPDTLALDLSLAERAVTDRTRAVIPVHFAGLPMDPAPLRELRVGPRPRRSSRTPRTPSPPATPVSASAAGDQPQRCSASTPPRP